MWRRTRAWTLSTASVGKRSQEEGRLGYLRPHLGVPQEAEAAHLGVKPAG